MKDQKLFTKVFQSWWGPGVGLLVMIERELIQASLMGIDTSLSFAVRYNIAMHVSTCSVEPMTPVSNISNRHFCRAQKIKYLNCTFPFRQAKLWCFVLTMLFQKSFASLSIWSLCFVLPPRFRVPECHRNRVESSTAEKVLCFSISAFASEGKPKRRRQGVHDHRRNC